jgi:integrase
MPAAARKIALTDRSLKALRPAPGGQRAVVWDALLPGMAVRVSGKGKRVFYAVKRRAGQTQPSWVLLGSYPVTTLAEARQKAREALLALGEGQHPTARTEARGREEEEAERRRRAGSFGAVAEDFSSRLEGGRITKVRGEGPLRNPGTLAAIIRRELVPVWKDRQIANITRRDVIALIEAILDRGGASPGPGTRRRDGGPYAARHALAAARRLFDWAVGRDILAASPCERVKSAELHGAPAQRKRVLTDEEVQRVWAAAGSTPYPYGSLVQILMLTGQRRREIASARWSEIDLDRTLLEIPAERMKADAGHVVPLTAKAVEILAGLPRFAAGDFVFAGQTGAKPFSGFSKAKARLDRKLVELVKAGERVQPIAPYTLHDLRRTVRTRLAELGVTPFVGELVIGHAQKGVHAVYDLHTYDAEKREALLKWEAKLLSIVAPEPAMPARARG